MKRAFFSIILLIAFVLNVYANMDSTKVKIDVVDITHTGLINAIKKNVLSDSICEKHKYTGNIIIARQYGHLYSYAYVGLFAKMNVKKRDINTQNNSVFTIIDNYPFFLNVIDGDPHKYYISKKKNYEITYYSYTDKKLVNNKIWIFLLLSDVEVLLMDTLSLNTEEKQSGQLPGEVVYGDAFDFRDGADEDVEYEYDSNGNMTVDLNRGIKEIEYDLNNRPVSVTFSTRPAEQRTKYLYDASGRKLRTTYQISRVMSVGPGGLGQIDTLELNPGIGGIGGIGGLKPLSSPASGLGGSLFDPGLAKDPGGMLDMWQTSYTRDYCGDIIYKDDEIERILTDNGYAVLDARTGGYKYYYYVKDYQGNIREVLDEAGNVVESNGYYPYGMPYADNYTSVQPYKYGGKELDRTNGLDMYDFHARQYDPAFPCFTSIDELCEKYPSISPYAYCMGNPINAIDPDGRRTWRIREDGSIYDYSDKNKSFDAFIIVDSKGNTKTDSDGNEIYIKFDYGTVTDVETFSIKAEKNKQRYNMVMFHIKGDDNAQQLFEFMANPQETTNVEWSHTKIGTEESQKNIVGTASSKEHTFQANYLIKKNYTIRSDAHSHPAGSGPSPADQDTYISAKNINPITIMYVYRINENNEKEYVPVQVK